MVLSEREKWIVTCVVYAIENTGKRLGVSSICSIPQWTAPISSEDAEKLSRCLDLHQLIIMENKAAIARITSADPDRLFEEYRFWFHDRDNRGITDDEVIRFRIRLKEELKERKQEQKAAPRTLYIADCHFYHRRLNTEMDYRGFASVEAMNQHMISQWNAKVRKHDTVYILGDFSLGDGFQTAGVMDCLNGKKHLIIGNHDERYMDDKYFDSTSLVSEHSYLEIRDHGRRVVLSHYPIFCYNGQYHRDKAGNPRTYMLYGHVHNTQDEKLINQFIMETRKTLVQSAHRPEPEPIPCNMINCFCMFSNYQPMTLDEWIGIDQRRRGGGDHEHS